MERIVLYGVLLLLLLCVLSPFFVPSKGKMGETHIYSVLDKLEGQKAILTNCYLPLRNGGTTEVDLILIHESGIYVVESKNYSGWIFGSEDQKYWTQSLPSRGRRTEKHKFYNPTWQNGTHIRCLKRILQDNTVPYYSYIVFGDGCELKNVSLTSGEHRVTYCRYLLKAISECAKYYGRRLTCEQIQSFYTALLPFTNVTEEQKEKHVREVYAKIHPVVQPDGTWTCPRCGGVLVERIAQRGSRAGKRFWGCSNYTKCKFTYDENIR